MKVVDRIIFAVLVFAIAISMFALVAIAASLAHSAEGGHTHNGAAGRFYQTWMMPDSPHVSCCHDDDCKPAASRMVDGHWEARWSDQDDWTPIPAGKVEVVRETPDGRSHMCGRRSAGGELYVFCFVRGGGV